VARLDNVGDVLLAGPAVRAVAATSAVTFLAGHRGIAAAHLLPGVDSVVEYTAAWIDPSPAAFDPAAAEALVATVRRLAVDEAVILTSSHQSPLPLALLLRWAGVPVVAAPSEDYPGSLLDVRHRVTGAEHEVERSLDVVARLGHRLPPGDDGRLRVTLPAARRPVRLPRSLRRGGYVVVHPGASVPARTWSPAGFAAAVGEIAAAGWPVVVTGGPDERDLTGVVAGGGAGPAGAPPAAAAVVDLGGGTTLAELADVLAGATVVVAGNTGAAHLAAAVGTPVVSVFPPTVPAHGWRPWGVPTIVLGDQHVACAGCRARTCPYPGQPCLAGVTPAAVVAAVEQLGARRAGTEHGPSRAAGAPYERVAP
jgi:ADP-heptose:LPS heptosyltransferase